MYIIVYQAIHNPALPVQFFKKKEKKKRQEYDKHSIPAKQSHAGSLSISITERLAVKTAGATAQVKKKKKSLCLLLKRKCYCPQTLFMEDLCKQLLSIDAI